jgi:hypothetical protein
MLGIGGHVQALAAGRRQQLRASGGHISDLKKAAFGAGHAHELVRHRRPALGALRIGCVVKQPDGLIEIGLIPHACTPAGSRAPGPQVNW